MWAKRRAIFSELRDTWGYLSKAGPPVGERELIHCLCERTSIILPDVIVVDCNDREITLKGFGLGHSRTMVFVPALIWRTSLDLDQRLQLTVEGYGKMLQTFLTDMSGEQWPKEDALCHVVVTGEEVCMWWGRSTEADAAVRLRPILRKEIGL
jgi:hypothetical protein